jgi:hypothetical protein
MPRSRTRQIVEELAREYRLQLAREARERYTAVAENVGLAQWEITASKQWLARQPVSFQIQVAERAERELCERLVLRRGERR